MLLYTLNDRLTAILNEAKPINDRLTWLNGFRKQVLTFYFKIWLVKLVTFRVLVG